METPGSHPGRSSGPPRRKAGLETPLVGRFGRENRRLIFAPPAWYEALVVICLAGWPVLIFLMLPSWGTLAWPIGLAVGGAGLWGALSNERLVCDLPARTYARLEGQGLRKRVTRGSLDDLDAIVLLTEVLPFSAGVTRPVIYRLVLHWKAACQPLLIIARESHNVATAPPLGGQAGRLQQDGLRFAAALGVKFFDNSHFPSPCPIPVT